MKQGEKILQVLGSKSREGWDEELAQCRKSIKRICRRIDKENEQITPSPREVFKPYDLISPYDVKLVIVGMDPYSHQGAATGVPFSSRRGIEVSAKAIFVSLSQYYKTRDKTFIRPKHCRFEPWFKQGVMMFNKASTTIIGESGKHLDLYSELCYATIQKIIQCNRNIVWLLMGKEAQSLDTEMIKGKGYPIKVPHPAARDGSFIKSQVFDIVNGVFRKIGMREIDFDLPLEWNDELEKEYNGKTRVKQTYPDEVRTFKPPTKTKKIPPKEESTSEDDTRRSLHDSFSD